MEKVVISHGKDIWLRTIKALEKLRPKLPKPGSSILIKPNLVEPMPRDSGAVTRPEFVKALVDWINPKKYEIIIGESSANYKTKKAFEMAGYYDTFENYDVKIVDFDDYGYVKVELNGVLWEQVEVTEWVERVDFIISAAVLKTHPLFEVTLTIKNIMGILKPEGLPNKHYIHPEKDEKRRTENFAERICDLISKIKIDLAAIDGTTAMLGNDHLHGPLEEKDLTIVGSDPVAVDLVGAKLLGKHNVYYLKRALERGLGKKGEILNVDTEKQR